MRAPGPVPVLAINGIGVIGVDTALLLRLLGVGMEYASRIRLTNPALLVWSSGEGDDMRLQEFPLLIDLDELVVVLPNEPVGCRHVFIAGIRCDGHGMGAQLIELSFGTCPVGAKDNAGGQDVLEANPPLHVIGIVVEVLMLI